MGEGGRKPVRKEAGVVYDKGKDGGKRDSQGGRKRNNRKSGNKQEPIIRGVTGIKGYER